MAVKFDTATDAHLLADAARDRVNLFEQRAQVLLKSMLPTPADASPALRSTLQSIVGAALALQEQDGKLATALDHFASIVERVPDLERRIAELEAKRHGG